MVQRSQALHSLQAASLTVLELVKPSTKMSSRTSLTQQVLSRGRHSAQQPSASNFKLTRMSITHNQTLLFEKEMTLKQACPLEYQGAQCAFKDSMIHGILQFTLRIAFRCVLHRCENQEIRCWKFWIFVIILQKDKSFWNSGFDWVKNITKLFVFVTSGLPKLPKEACKEL